MTETAEDLTRRHLVPVARLNLLGEPDLTHLSVYQRMLMSGEEWATGPALCGRSTTQGPLPDGTEVTCGKCLAYQSRYERMLAPGYRPEDDDPDVLRERLERAHAELTSMSGQIGDLRRELEAHAETRQLLSQWGPELRAAFPVLFKKLDILLTLRQSEEGL
ncbi:hypothetical protein ACFV6B_13035 [Streptomyces microflavus]|uniref:hypothetical protein n=1 Tax=Streptomyces microflavus TaxID=1919 RepID=UPI00364F684E